MVIGLQSTGEARTADVVAERGELLDDYVSGPRVRSEIMSDRFYMSCLPQLLSAVCHHLTLDRGLALLGVTLAPS